MLLPETLSGEKRTTWRKNTGDPNQMWARVRKSLSEGREITGHHYWKVRTPKIRKPVHLIGISKVTAVVPRRIDSITRDDAALDGFHGGVERMKLALTLLGGSHKKYWQVFYDPGWVLEQ